VPVLVFEDFVEQSEAATTVSQLKAYFERVMTDEGFENHFIGRIVGGKVTETYWVEFPRGHFETYLAEEWDRVDPILGFTATATRPFCWDDVASRMAFSRDQTALLDECKRVGVHSIIVAPFPNPNGGCDIVGVSRRHAESPGRARIAVLQAVCAQTWCRYADLAGDRPDNGHDQITLTNRELEILKWVKDGKSNSEISEIMNLSVKTIEYHVGNLLKKLGATNRTTAVVIAIKHRLLAL
jgi:DNA-binding CsgD family transcriptional regulator